MWCCCCPQKEEEESTSKSLKEDLVQKVRKSQPQIEVTSSRYEEAKEKKEEVQITREPRVINPHLEKMRQIEAPQPVKMEMPEEIPKEEPRGPFRSLLKAGSHQEIEKMKKRSQLWSQQSGSKILYINSEKDEQMIFSFKINKIKLDQNHPMNFILQPVRYGNPSHNITKAKPVQITVCLIISTKSLTQIQTSIAKIASEYHMKPIFGLLKKDVEEKLSRSYYESQTIHEIIIIDKGCLRLQSIDKIIISLRDQKDFNTIFGYCQKITQQFELQDLIKVTFIFPSFLTLSEICLILSKLFRKFIISEKLQRILKYLAYHIQMIQTITQQFEEIIIVSIVNANLKLETGSQKEFENKLELALGMLMIEVDSHTFKIYETVIQNFLTDKTITEYLKFIQFVHKDREKKEFINTLSSLKLFSEDQLVEIANANRISQTFLSESQKMIVIKHQNKKKIGQLFNKQMDTKTPIQQFDKKKQWDDDLKEHDIKVTIMDRNMGNNHLSKYNDNNCNIFQVIDEDYVEKADLELLSHEEELIFQEDQV